MAAGPLDFGVSRWEFQPPLMWRNGLGVHQDPQADVADSARSLANDCLRKQLRIGREKTQDKQRSPHSTGPARKGSRESVEHGVTQVRAPGSLGTSVPPLPRPQFSHLRNDSMTHITGLFGQLCKMWPDMIQSTAKPFWSVMAGFGEKFELHKEGFNAGHKSYHGGST